MTAPSDARGARSDSAVDVVVPTRDRPSALAACLRALAGQSIDRFGVIVVDDGGRVPAQEGLPATLRSRATFLRNEHPLGPAASRNRGAARSAAPYLLFLDDDCIAHPELVERHRAALTASDGPVVSLGPILSPPGRRMPAWTHWDADRLEREYTRLVRGERSPGWMHLYTGNVGLRRADFAAVGGFDPRFARQEDVELGFRLAGLGCHFTFDAGAVVHHDSDRSLRSWLRIPAASARFDLLMDELVPDEARRRAARAGLAARHPALRAARRLARPHLVRHSVVGLAVATGCVLHALRADRAALAAFSLVWDLEYTAVLPAGRA